MYKTGTLLAAALMLGACSKNSDELLESARTHLEKGDSKSAVIETKNALQLRPNAAPARLLLGQALLRSGDAQGAIVELQRALELGGPPAKILPTILEALSVSLRFKTITDQYAATRIEDPQAQADVKTLVAAAFASQGNTQQADLQLKAALAARPEHPAALLLKARFLASTGDAVQSQQIVDRVIAAAPDTADAWYLKGDLLAYFQNDPEAAKAAYTKSTLLRPDFLAAHTALIALLLARNDLPAAQLQLEVLRKASPRHPQVLYFDTQLAYLKSNTTKARELAQQLLKLAPDNPKVLQLAGAIAYNGGAPLQAESYLEKALHASPDLQVARILLARTQLRAGKPRLALNTLGPLIDGTAATADALFLAGQAQLQLGQPEQAERLFARSAELNPKDGRTRTALALSRMTGDNTNETFGELRAIAAQDDEPSADLALIAALLNKREFTPALAALDALGKKQPGKPLAFNLRGRVLLAQGDRVGARSNFERALAADHAFVPAASALAQLDLLDNKPESARKRFETVLAAAPDNLDALLAIAGLKARAGAPLTEVVASLNEAANRNPGEWLPRLALINYLLERRDVKAAVAQAQNAAGVFPDSPELLDALGRAQLAAGETNQALASFTRLVNQRPDFPDFHLRLATVNLLARKSDAARQNLRQAIAVRPDFLPAQQMLTHLLVSLKQPDEAMTIAKTVQKQRPLEAAGYVLQGAVETSLNRAGAAAEAYRLATVRSQDGNVAAQYHAALRAQKKRDEAAAFAASWLAKRPKDIEFLNYLGEQALRDADLQQADKLFDSLVDASPADAAALNNAAWVKLKLQKPGGLALARRANEARPNTPAFMDTLALALASEKQLSDALALQKKALTFAPNSPSLHLSLAKIYLLANDKASARAELDALSRLPAPSAERVEAGELLSRLAG